jgi:hypothetical protein
MARDRNGGRVEVREGGGGAGSEVVGRDVDGWTLV